MINFGYSSAEIYNQQTSCFILIKRLIELYSICNCLKGFYILLNYLRIDIFEYAFIVSKFFIIILRYRNQIDFTQNHIRASIMAIGAVSSLALPSMGDDVSYWLLPDDSNAQLFQSGKTFHQFDQGKGIAAYGKNTDRLQGTFYVALLNDNYVQGIDVDVKISVIRETKFYETRPTREPVLTPRYENKTFSEPVVKTVRIPATGQ